jgi:hypothetical protein
MSVALAFALVVGAWTNGAWGTSRSRQMVHHVTSGDTSGTDPGDDGVRNQAPFANSRLIVSTAVTVGLLRVVYPPSAVVMPTTDHPFTTTRRLLGTSHPEDRHDPPHLHAFSLLI